MRLCRQHAEVLEELYHRYNRREYVHPDPLEFVYRYDRAADREVVALIASCLAYGRVGQILASVQTVLEPLGPRPADYIAWATPAKLRKNLAGFRHRFNTADDLAAVLVGIKRAIARHGSLGACFASALRPGDQTVLAAVGRFARELSALGGRPSHLLPDPAGHSACKRLNLLLRWMVRQDRVDVGLWSQVDPAKLIVPLDTHMHKIALALGLTRRRGCDARTAVDITRAYRTISPRDPVRYDFALTRLGIRRDSAMAELLNAWPPVEVVDVR